MYAYFVALAFFHAVSFFVLTPNILFSLSANRVKAALYHSILFGIVAVIAHTFWYRWLLVDRPCMGMGMGMGFGPGMGMGPICRRCMNPGCKCVNECNCAKPGIASVETDAIASDASESLAVRTPYMFCARGK